MNLNLDVFLEGYFRLGSFLDSIWKLESLSSLDRRYIDKLRAPLDSLDKFEMEYLNSTAVKLKDIYQITFAARRTIRLLEVEGKKFNSIYIDHITNGLFFGTLGVNISETVEVNTNILNLLIDKDKEFRYRDFVMQCVSVLCNLTEVTDTDIVYKSENGRLFIAIMTDIMNNKLLGRKGVFDYCTMDPKKDEYIIPVMKQIYGMMFGEDFGFDQNITEIGCSTNKKLAYNIAVLLEDLFADLELNHL